MVKSLIADNKPKGVDLKAGDQVWWCRCGRSQKQPFCDGSHKGTGMEPMPFTAERDDRYFFCQCKRTGDQPLCDGSHKKIDPEELAHLRGS